MHIRSGFKSNKRSHSGDDSIEDPPVPIPNTEVKLYYDEDGFLKTAQCAVLPSEMSERICFARTVTEATVALTVAERK